MRILQVVPYFYPAWAYGGPGKLVYDTSLYYAQMGFHVDIFTSDCYDKHSRMPKALHVTNINNLTVHYFKNLSNYLSYHYNVYFTPALFFSALYKVPKSDVIHMHDFYTLQNIWIGLIARLTKTPYIISVHGCLEKERLKKRSFGKKFFLFVAGRSLLKRAKYLIASSPNELDAYVELGIPEKNIVSLGHGVEPSEFQTSASKTDSLAEFNLPQDRIIVTFLGRIHKIKGLDLLIEAVAKIKDPRLYVVIAGSDDGYLDELKKLIDRHKLHSRVQLVGTCYGEQKARLFKASDVFVYPSYSEGFSLGLLEAAATGLPLVITTECHFQEIEEAKAGVVVNCDADEIANALSLYINDSKKRETSAQNAYSLIVRKYSKEFIFGALIDLYTRAIQKAT